MTITERLPAARRGQALSLGAAAVVWFAIYQLNEHLWDWILYDALGMDPAALVTETIHFFLYDTIKIGLLLVIIIFAVTFLRSVMSVERTRALHGEVIDRAAGLTFDDRVSMSVEEVGTVPRKIWPYLLVGIGLGAVIHGWVPTDFFTTYAGPGSTSGVLIAVGLGIPLYSNAAGIMPLVQALYDKGLPMGTLLAFRWLWSRSLCPS